MMQIGTRRLAGALLLCLLLTLAAACGGSGAGEAQLSYRFADKDEAAELLLSNRDYFENLNQSNLDYRMQKKDAALEELEAFTAAQTLDFTDEEKAAVDFAMGAITRACEERGYRLPAADDIVFAKTTMEEECGAGGYTHGKQIYLGEELLEYGVSADPADQVLFRQILAHELFHCLTRQHPDFRADMYALLGFTVEEADYDFPPAVRDRIINNPDVEHYNSHAAFAIDGETRDCVVIFTSKPFEQPGDSFFDEMQTCLVPVDDLSAVYSSEDAENFWEVFGENTDYVIDPEEALADNFAYAVVYGPDGANYKTPALIEAIDAYLKG